jgi:hypothetical protein
VSKYRGDSFLIQMLDGVLQVFNTLPKFGLGEDVATNHADVERKLVRQAIAGLAAGERIQVIVFASPDNINHLEGFQTDEGDNLHYVRQLAVIDSLIGVYRDASRALGTEDDRLYLVTSDHGLTRVTNNVSLVGTLEARYGLRGDRDMAVRKRERFDKPLQDYVDADIDVVQALQGNTMSFLYFRNPHLTGIEAWQMAPSAQDLADYPIRDGSETVNLVDAVVRLESTELVLHKSAHAGRYLVSSRDGTGEIVAFDHEVYSYSVVAGSDPLGYGTVADGVPRHEDDWLRLTYLEPYPYAVPLIGRLLTAHPDADLVVTARPGYDHGLDFEILVGNYRGGHGGLEAAQLVVPFILAGPGVRSGETIPYARPEDIGNTLLHLLDVPPLESAGVLHAALVDTARTPHEGIAR